MPHSSGGGSHGGGSHSSHSSHSSRGGSSSRPMHRIRHTAFAGSRRYVCYRKNKAEYVYANYDLGKKTSKASYLILLVYLPFLAVAIGLLMSSYHHPKKLTADYNTSIVIDDRAGLIEDSEEEDLQKTFQTFYDKTGITPAVITVNNEDWTEHYTSLENYAYELYVNTFDDEKHWLIVYSEASAIYDSFNDWYWEGMQGDDTDDIITEGVADDFTNNLQRYLLQNTRYTPGSAIEKAFSELTPVIMKPYWIQENLLMAVCMLVFILFHASAMTGITPNGIKYRKAVACPQGAVEYRCTYCGGIYVVGTCITCPHCGAPVVKRDDLE